MRDGPYHDDMADFDDMLTRLGEVTDALIALPDDAFAERDALRREQDELRERLADLRGDADPDADRPTSDLERELAGLEAGAEGLRKQKIDYAKQMGGGPGGAGEMPGVGSVGLNIGMAEATGLAAMERRMRRIRSILADREAD